MIIQNIKEIKVEVETVWERTRSQYDPEKEKLLPPARYRKPEIRKKNIW